MAAASFLGTLCPQCKRITISDSRYYPAKLHRNGCGTCSHRPVQIVKSESLDGVAHELTEEIERFLTELGDDFGRPFLVDQLSWARRRYFYRKDAKLRAAEQRERHRTERLEIKRRKDVKRVRAVEEGRAAVITLQALEAARVIASELGRSTKLTIKCPRCGSSNKCSWSGWGRGHCRRCNAWWVVQKPDDVPVEPPSYDQLAPHERRIRDACDPAFRRSREREATAELKAIHEEWLRKGRTAPSPRRRAK